MAAPRRTPAPLFDGPHLATLLETRTVDAVAAATRFDRSTDASYEALAQFIAATDLASAVVVWDAPNVHHSATDDQRMQTILRWPIRGNASALTWRPTRRALTGIPVVAGQDGAAVIAIIEGRHVSAADVLTAQRRVRAHVDRHLGYIERELTAWRAEMSRRIRDAVYARYALLVEVETLAASAAFDALDESTAFKAAAP